MLTLTDVHTAENEATAFSLACFLLCRLPCHPLPFRRQELPRITRERPADWARLVEGLDPVTAYVVTTKWESAGGAADMPEFYAAVFGTGEEDAAGAPSAAAEEGGGVVGATGSDVGVAGGVGGSSGGGAGGVLLLPGWADEAAAATTSALNTAGVGGDGVDVEAASPAATAQQEKQNVAGAGDVRSEEGVKGVALQERLVRLRKAFAKEQCAAVLKQATGW